MKISNLIHFVVIALMASIIAAGCKKDIGTGSATSPTPIVTTDGISGSGKSTDGISGGGNSSNGISGGGKSATDSTYGISGGGASSSGVGGTGASTNSISGGGK